MDRSLSLDVKNSRILKQMYKFRHYYFLLIPVVAYFIIFQYIPMYGITIAFKEYSFSRGILGSPWVGLENFKRFFNSEYCFAIIRNTVVISLLKLAFDFPAPILFALLLNELRKQTFKKIVQTVSYLPYFISWVVLGGIIKDLLSPASTGVVNSIITLTGGKPIYFLTEPGYFRSILVTSDVWVTVGWSSVIYLAAIVSIDIGQYEAAFIDGANRFKQAFYITLPGIFPIILIVFILNLGNILNAGFDQILNLYNPIVYSVGDIIDTYIYRVGLLDMSYGYSCAINLFKNIIGFSFVVGANSIVRRFSENSLW